MKPKDSKKAEILNYLAQGYSNEESFKKAGLGKSTFHKWMEQDSEFRDAVHRAREESRILKTDVRSVENSLLDIAKGFEYEEVRTEYESRQVENENTGKKEYKLIVKKQVKTQKRVLPNVEAIKFLLTNRDPDNWKNRVDTTQMGHVETDITIKYRGDDGEAVYPSSENELDLERTEEQ